MGHRTHAVEEMRRVARARGNRGLRLLVRRAGMAKRHPHASGHERSNEREAVLELRRHRDDADVGPRVIDHLEHIAPREVGRRGAGRRRQGGRTAQTRERLRAAVLGVDEVALKVGGQHARARAGGAAQPPHFRERRAERHGR